MAKPRIFISSSFYDLKHIRSSLDVFITSLGFESILSEKGDIAYSPDQPPDESCYREAESCDILVLLIGGRYGSPSSREADNELSKGFFEPYESVTKLEYKAALERDVPVYILIEAGVFNEFQTYRRNRENDSITYAHVDSVNIFKFIDEILHQKRNNAVHSFEKYTDIEYWLREQWAGLFRDFLTRRSGQKDLASLANQVSELTEVNRTLKKYIEMIVSQVAPGEESAEIIEYESKRLDEYRRIEQAKRLWIVEANERDIGVDYLTTIKLIREASSLSDLRTRLKQVAKWSKNRIDGWFKNNSVGFIDVNKVRKIFDLPEFDAD